jgi:hypothetical protein
MVGGMVGRKLGGHGVFQVRRGALGGGDALSRTEHAGEQKLFDGRHHSTSEVLCVGLVKGEISAGDGLCSLETLRIPTTNSIEDIEN